MATIITKDLALQITKKLNAVKREKKGSPHDYYPVIFNGQLITVVGIRRGSRRDMGHDHVPKQLFTTPRNAKEFAICNLDVEWWIAEMRRQGRIRPEE